MAQKNKKNKAEFVWEKSEKDCILADCRTKHRTVHQDERIPTDCIIVVQFFLQDGGGE
jgi:hypothetical protein